MAIAIVCTWFMNRLWTFGSRDPRKLAELQRYTLVSLVSAGVNYLGYAACLSALAYSGWPLRHVAAIFAASAFGSALASIVTFCLSRRYAFRPVKI